MPCSQAAMFDFSPCTISCADCHSPFSRNSTAFSNGSAGSVVSMGESYLHGRVRGGVTDRRRMRGATPTSRAGGSREQGLEDTAARVLRGLASHHLLPGLLQHRAHRPGPDAAAVRPPPVLGGRRQRARPARSQGRPDRRQASLHQALPRETAHVQRVWKTVIYVLASLFLHYLEHLTRLWWRLGSFSVANDRLR